MKSLAYINLSDETRGEGRRMIRDEMRGIAFMVAEIRIERAIGILNFSLVLKFYCHINDMFLWNFDYDIFLPSSSVFSPLYLEHPPIPPFMLLSSLHVTIYVNFHCLLLSPFPNTDTFISTPNHPPRWTHIFALYEGPNMGTVTYTYRTPHVMMYIDAGLAF